MLDLLGQRIEEHMVAILRISKHLFKTGITKPS